MAGWSAARGRRLRELSGDSGLGVLFPSISFEFNEAEIGRLARDFARFPGAASAACAHATEKTRKIARREFIAGFSAMLTLMPAYIRRGVKSKKAQGGQAEIRIATSNIPLIRYGVKPQAPPKLRGVSPKSRPKTSYRLRKSGGAHERPFSDAAPYGAKLFVQRMKSGHIGVFYRNGKSISEDWAPSLQYHAYAEGFLPRMESLVRKSFEAAFLEEAGKISGES